MSKPSLLQFLLRRKPVGRRTDDLASTDPERKGQGLFRLGRTKMRLGDTAEALGAFDQALTILPNYAEAVAARAESLDMLGKSEAARPEYERARRLWAEQRTGAPDRSYLFRQHGRFTFEVDSYELALERIKTGSFPHLACGNALLAQGRAAEALRCYDRALKIKQNEPNLMALRGEALSMDGQYAKAIEAFDFALAALPKSAEILSARAIAYSALGKLAEANADWRRQLDLLSAGQHAARAYVALRLADYALAATEIERAATATPNDLYWQLYRLTALRRLGRPLAGVEPPARNAWPAPLIALHLGKASEEDVRVKADTPCRRAETAFQLGRWQEVVEIGLPALIEYGAARNELSRLGS